MERGFGVEQAPSRIEERLDRLDRRLSELEDKLARELRAQCNRFIAWTFAGVTTFVVLPEFLHRLG